MKKIICILAIILLTSTFLIGCSAAVVPGYSAKWHNTDNETIIYSISTRTDSEGKKYEYPIDSYTVAPIDSIGTYTVTISRNSDKHTVSTLLDLKETYYMAQFSEVTNEQQFLQEFACVNPVIATQENQRIVTFSMSVETKAVFNDKPFGKMISSSRITKSVYAYKVDGLSYLQLNNFQTSASYSDDKITYIKDGKESAVGYSGTVIDNEILLVYLRSINTSDLSKVTSVSPIQCFNLNTGTITNLTFNMVNYNQSENVTIDSIKYTTSLIQIYLANADYTGTPLMVYLNGDVSDKVVSGTLTTERNKMIKLQQDHLEFNLFSDSRLED